MIAGSLSYALGVKNLHVINVEYYTGVNERLEFPVMLPPPLNLVDLADARVLVADDVADTGDTLAVVRDFCARAGGRGPLRRAVPKAPVGGFLRVRLARTDRWINFPWSTAPPLVAGATGRRTAEA